MLGIDSQFNLMSYAVLSAKYEMNSDMYGSFLPLLEHVLLSMEKDYVEESHINDTYYEIYGYEMPSAILTNLLKVLVKQGKIVRLKGENIQINKDKIDTYGTKDSYEREMRALISNIDFFLKKRNIKITREDIPKYVINFLKKNLVNFGSFMSYESDFEEDENSGEIFGALTEFLIEERKNDSSSYKFFKDIYEGLVLSTIIVCSENEKEESYYTQKVSIKNVLLDSNYIFRLLDLQTVLEHQSAEETYTILKSMQCNFWVCQETLKQIVDTIQSYMDSYSETANTVLRISGEESLSGLGSACVRRTLKKTQLEKIIYNLEDTLKNEYGVQIIDNKEFNEKNIDKNSKEFLELKAIKSASSDFSVTHDLLLIHIVKEKRPPALYKAEQADWWVLTDDNKLTKWNSENRTNKRVPECMTETQLATILWLCNPQKTTIDGLFNTVLAYRSQKLIGNAEYTRICREIEYQVSRYDGNESAIAIIFAQGFLTPFDMLDDREKTNDLIDQLIVESQKEKEEKYKAIAERTKIRETENKELIEKLSEKDSLISKQGSLISETKQKLIYSLQIRRDEKQEKINENIKEIEKLEKRDNTIINAIIIICCFLIAISVIIVLSKITIDLENFYSKNQLKINIGIWTTTFILAVLGIKMDNFNKFISNIIRKVIKPFKILSEKKINEFEEENEVLTEELFEIQDQIEEELEQ